MLAGLLLIVLMGALGTLGARRALRRTRGVLITVAPAPRAWRSTLAEVPQGPQAVPVDQRGVPLVAGPTIVPAAGVRLVARGGRRVE